MTPRSYSRATPRPDVFKDARYAVLDDAPKTSPDLHGRLSIAPARDLFAGWTRPSVAVACVALLGVAAWSFVRLDRPNAAQEKTPSEEDIDLGSLLIGGVLVALVVSISGSGGWGYQDPIDWEKHNAILHDLIYNPWPVVYDLPTEPVAMVYYIAYYLPAAAVGKLLGWQAANHVLFLTTFFGAMLAYLWVVVLTRAHPLLCAALFLGFSGMDVLGNLFFGAPRWDHLEWWSQPFGQYGSNTSMLFWVPHQALAGWLIAALAVHASRRRCLRHLFLFLIALSSLWSPLVGIGIALLVTTLLVANYRDRPCPLFESVSWCNVAGTVIGGVLFLYFLARYDPYALPAHISELPSGSFALNVWRDGSATSYVCFVLLEFAVLYALIAACWQSLGSEARKLFWVTLPFLLFLPLFRYGFANDLVMRASIPALFVAMVLTVQVVSHFRGRLFRVPVATIMVFVLLVSSMTPIVEVYRHGHQTYHGRDFVTIPKHQKVDSVWELQREGAFGRDEFNFAGQYVGATHSLFGRYLAKKQSP